MSEKLAPWNATPMRERPAKQQPEGWYPAPDPVPGPPMERWWTGTAWTEHRREAALPKYGAEYVRSAYIAAVLVPVVGLVWGLIMAARGNLRGLGVCAVAIVSAVVVAALLSA